ncbi:MAG: dihydroorotate dehydrogenase 2 [Chloroflexota bacterium]
MLPICAKIGAATTGVRLVAEYSIGDPDFAWGTELDAYTDLVRRLLFRLSADQAHALARLALRWPAVWRPFGRSEAHPRLETNLAGVRLPTPIGLAPGFDKSGELLPGLSRLGFGYLMCGSITKEPRYGNPFPRLVRYPERQSIANSMGLPNPGLLAAAAFLRKGPKEVPVMASVAGFSAAELVASALALEPYVAATEIGLVCPNTSETERLEEMRTFTELAAELGRRKSKPVFVKLPPHHDDVRRQQVQAMVDACVGAGLDGVSLSGTRPIEEPRLGMGRGSLAGRDVFHDSLRIVRDVAERAAGRLAIKGAGGVSTGRDADDMLAAGADSVELYSAFIYRGWNVARLIARELLAELDARGVEAVAAIRPVASVPA